MARSTMAPKEGIRDWAAKRSFLRAVYDEANDKSLVINVVGTRVSRHEKMDVAEKCYDTFRRWNRSSPTSPSSLEFWKWIIKTHNLNVRAPTLWSCTIEEFISHFPPSDAEVNIAVGQLLEDPRADLDEETKDQLRKKYQTKLAGELDDAAVFREYTVGCSETVSFEGPQTGMQNGRIQHAQFYTVPEAAVAWAELVDSENYRMYLDCLLSLEELVLSQFWLDAIEDGRHSVAVILGGGGSPEKDWILAQSLLRAVNRLELILTDISIYMIGESAKVLQRRIARKKLASRIEPAYRVCDFLKLDEQFFRQENWGSVVWALLGGTIGNVPAEIDFFRSIKGPSKVGDLLVVGVDTIDDGESEDQMANRMSTQYRSKELDALLLTPLMGKTGWDPHSPEPLVNVTVSGSRNPHSDVPSSRTAVFSTPFGGPNDKDITLATSTRYVAGEFIAYARRFGWRHLGTAKSSEDSTYNQLLLQRIK